MPKTSHYAIAFLTMTFIAFPALSQKPAAQKGQDKKLVLFPLEAVNVSEGAAEATALLLRNELVKRGYEVTPAADVNAALAEIRKAPNAEQKAAAEDQADDDSSNRAPADTQLGPAADSPVDTGVTSDSKRAATKRLEAAQYLDASLVALGSRYQLDITWRAADGTFLTSKSMVAKTEDDLNTVIPRIVEALVTSKKVDETRTLDNASLAETDNLPNRFRLEKNFGPAVGMLVGFDEVETGPVVGFNARLEVTNLLIDLIAMLGFPSVKNEWGDTDVGIILEANVGLGGYLTHTQVSPYLLGGFGVWVGDRFGSKKIDDDEYETNSGVGGDVFGAVGVEFLRHTRIRLHADLRYVLSFTGDGDVGHSLLPMVGLNF